MKKFFISLLISLVSLHGMAIIEDTLTVKFDFSNPYALHFTPALPTLQDTDGNLLMLSRFTVSEGPVSISFGVGQGNLGPTLYRSGSFYTLNIRKWSTLTFTVSGDCQLSNIQFTGANGLICPSGQPGRFDPSNNRWYSFTSSNVTSITVEQGPNEDSWCPLITVTYLRKPADLVLNSTNPAYGATVTSFKSIDLHFNTDVGSVSSDAVMTLSGTGINGKRSLMPTIINNTIRLTTTDVITTDGVYTVNVSKGAFASTKGAVLHDSINVQFQVRANRATFTPTAISPAPGKYGALPNLLMLKFNNFVKLGTGTVKFVHKNGTRSFPATLSASNDTVKIYHEYGLLTDAGVWNVEIPEKVIHNPFIGDDADDRWNPAMTLEYLVDPSESLPDDSEAMKMARELLLLDGVGYAKTTTESYQTLKALVNAEVAPADSILEAAILALCNETDVNLPVIDNWYKIAGVNSMGDKIYLTLNEDNTKVILGQSATNAASFKVKSLKNDTIVFMTKDSLFLHIPTVLPMRKGTTDSNLTEQVTNVNNLVISKFITDSIENVSPIDVYGLFSIFGSLGTFNNKEEFAYAMFDYDAGKIITYPEWPLEFNASMSSAFMFEESVEPVAGDVIIPTVGLRPDAINEPGDEMLLVIFGPRKSTIINSNQICFKKDGKKVDFYDTILIPMPTENQFAVNTEGLDQGTYTIEMPLGTFSFEAVKGKKIQDVALSAEFYIRSSGTVVTDGITPVATLSPTNIWVSGEQLVLTIENVSKAILNTAAVCYFIYADGDKAGERAKDVKLSAIRGTTNQFYVDTKDLKGGKYTLVIPKKTFTYTAKEDGKTVIDVPFTLDFSIEGFQSTYNSYMVLIPASINNNSLYMRDVDMNQMILYIYDYMADGLVPNPDAKVWIVYSLFGTPVLSGHFEEYPTFAEDYGSGYENTHALKFIPDRKIQPGELDNFPGIYGFYCGTGAFGDANYGKYLAGDKSIRPEDCSINSAGTFASFDIDYIKGDVNGDKKVDVADIASVVSIMAGEKDCIYADVYADVNRDGTVDVADIATIISCMAELARPQQIDFEDE